MTIDQKYLFIYKAELLFFNNLKWFLFSNPVIFYNFILFSSWTCDAMMTKFITTENSKDHKNNQSNY